MLEAIQTELNQGVSKLAENSLIKKLNEQGISRSDLTNEKLILKELFEVDECHQFIVP